MRIPNNSPERYACSKAAMTLASAWMEFNRAPTVENLEHVRDMQQAYNLTTAQYFEAAELFLVTAFTLTTGAKPESTKPLGDLREIANASGGFMKFAQALVLASGVNPGVIEAWDQLNNQDDV